MFQIYIVLQINPLFFRGSISRIKFVAMMPKPDLKHFNCFICSQMDFLVFPIFVMMAILLLINFLTGVLSFFCLFVSLLLNLIYMFSLFHLSCDSRGGLWGGLITSRVWS